MPGRVQIGGLKADLNYAHDELERLKQHREEEQRLLREKIRENEQLKESVKSLQMQLKEFQEKQSA